MCTSSGGGTAGTGETCPLTCGDFEKVQAQNYYRDTSEFRGRYTMTPMFAVKVNENTCDINYTFSGPTTGRDYRRFTYETGCVKLVTGMGGTGSGLLAQTQTG